MSIEERGHRIERDVQNAFDESHPIDIRAARDIAHALMPDGFEYAIHQKSDGGYLCVVTGYRRTSD